MMAMALAVVVVVPVVVIVAAAAATAALSLAEAFCDYCKHENNTIRTADPGSAGRTTACITGTALDFAI